MWVTISSYSHLLLPGAHLRPLITDFHSKIKFDATLKALGALPLYRMTFTG